MDQFGDGAAPSPRMRAGGLHHDGALRWHGGPRLDLGMDREPFPRREGSELSAYGGLIGVSAASRLLFRQLSRLEASKVNVLIVGETGTGKELVARAIHDHSVVRRGPLVTVNCGALDRHLARSELFGHLRGAFTGALHSQPGAFASADGGTLFLDELGELPPDVQPILLRALESRAITPVGGHAERAVNVRLIAATHRDLRAEVAAGRFREDLFYRIQVVRLDVPPLRERSDDIPVLAQWLARHQGVPSLPGTFLAALSNHTWPGNVRELRNAVEAYIAVGAVPPCIPANVRLLDDALAGFVCPTRSYADQKQDLMECFSRAYLQCVLEHTAGNQSEAARIAGLERSYLGKLVNKLGLRRG